MGCCVGDCCVCYCGFCCVMDFCSDSCCVGHTTVSNDSVEHTKKINEELNELREKYEDDAAAIENNIINEINSSMVGFISELKDMNDTSFSGFTLSIDIQSIEKKREALKEEVVGVIGKRVRCRMVTTDAELAPILQERDDNKRNKNIDDFCKKVLNGAKKDLKEQIKITVAAQQDVVRKELENRLEEVNNGLAKKTKDYDEFLLAAERGELEKERQKLKSMYETGIYTYIENEIGVTKDIEVGVNSNKVKKVRQKED